MWVMNIYRENLGFSLNKFGDFQETKPLKIATRITLQNMDTLAFVGFFCGIVSFLTTFNVEGMPWLPYPLVGNIQDVDKNTLPRHWEQGAVLIVLLWGISYLRKSILVILKQKYLMNVTLLDACETTKNIKQSKKRYHVQSINNNVDISVISDSITNNVQKDASILQTQHNTVGKEYQHSEENACNYILPTLIFHIFFGAWIGWACNTHVNIQYRSSDEEWLATGMLMWLISEVSIIARTIIFYRKGKLFDNR